MIAQSVGPARAFADLAEMLDLGQARLLERVECLHPGYEMLSEVNTAEYYTNG